MPQFAGVALNNLEDLSPQRRRETSRYALKNQRQVSRRSDARGVSEKTPVVAMVILLVFGLSPKALAAAPYPILRPPL
jgi:hypothetical protein